MLQVTGGSLEESREALAIAETDGLYISPYFFFFIDFKNLSLQPFND